MPISPDRQPGYFLKLMREKNAAGGEITFVRRPDGTITAVPTSNDVLDARKQFESIIFNAGKSPVEAEDALSR